MPKKPDDASPPSSSTRSAGRLWLRSLPLVMLTTALAVVLTAVKAPARAAIDPADVTWAPGNVSWEIIDDGRCVTSQPVTVSTESADDAAALSQAMHGLPRKRDFPAESGIQDAHANVSTPIGTTYFAVVMHTYLPGEECLAATAAQQALFDSGGGRLDSVQPALATWKKIAIAAVVAAAVYAAVSLLVLAALAALDVAVATSTAAQVAAGCIAGTASALVASKSVTGWPNDWKAQVVTAVGACLTGGASGVLPPTAAAGQAIGNALRTTWGSAPVVKMVGDGAFAAAESAGIDLVMVSQATNATADAALALA